MFSSQIPIDRLCRSSSFEQLLTIYFYTYYIFMSKFRIQQEYKVFA